MLLLFNLSQVDTEGHCAGAHSAQQMACALLWRNQPPRHGPIRHPTRHLVHSANGRARRILQDLRPRLDSIGTGAVCGCVQSAHGPGKKAPHAQVCLFPLKEMEKRANEHRTQSTPFCVQQETNITSFFQVPPARPGHLRWPSRPGVSQANLWHV